MITGGGVQFITDEEEEEVRRSIGTVITKTMKTMTFYHSEEGETIRFARGLRFSPLHLKSIAIFPFLVEEVEEFSSSLSEEPKSSLAEAYSDATIGAF